MSDDSALIERLLAANSPSEVGGWQTEEGQYLEACHLSREDIPGLLRQVQRWPEMLKTNCSVDDEPVEVKKQLLPVTAWRALAELHADEAVSSLIEMMQATVAVYKGTTDFDDWSFEELPHVFGKIGPTAIEPLQNLVSDREVDQDARTIAVRGLGEIAQAHSAARERVVPILIKLMEQADAADIDLNTTVLNSLVDLHVTEAAAAIERAFSRNVLDHGMMGDWEAVRTALGVASLGLPMPAEPFDSLRETRARSKELIDLLRTRAAHDDEFGDEAFELDFDENDSDTAGSAPLQRLEKIGRNDPCSCGSGKKYKKCCGRAF